MRSILNYILLLTGVTVFLAACDKVDDLPYYGKGTAVSLTASTATVAPTPADSSRSVVDFTWSDPKYATDTNNYKFIVEIDSAGKNFSKPYIKELLGKRTFSLTGREINAILLSKGFELGKAHALDVRVTSSYANNNERYQSNTVKLMVTPFADPSKLTASTTTVTGTLNTAGEKAITFTWTPSFKGFADSITYQLQYDLNGSNFASPSQQLVGKNTYTKDLTYGQVNDIAINEGIAGGTTGKIDFRVRATTPQGAVAFSDVVSITVNTYVPEAPYATLYMVGDATEGGWDNSKATPIFRDGTDPFGYNYTGYFNAGSFKFLGTLGQWAPMYGTNSPGTLTFRATESDPDPGTINIATAGYYRLTLNLRTLTYTIQSYNASTATVYPSIGIIGSFNGWGDITPMTKATSNPHIWEIEQAFTGAEELKFRHAPDWSKNWGPAEENRVKLYGTGIQDGKNIKVTAGTYRILFNDITGEYTFIKK
jgi:starch-binding outer membrane protein SusE/F